MCRYEGKALILLLGGSGQLGSAIRRQLVGVRAPTRPMLDIADLGSLQAALNEERPSVLINCAAFNDVDGAESDSETAFRVNTEAVGVMAEHCASRDIPFVTFSTNYVFDGDSATPYLESSPVSPLNAYGRSKLQGEELALGYEGSLVIRTSWLFSGEHENNFVAWVLRRVAEGPVSVVTDEVGCPTPAASLAAAAIRHLRKGTRGLLHLAGWPPVSRFDFARSVVAETHLPMAAVNPCLTKDLSLAVVRPARSVLQSERVSNPIGWASELPGVVSALWRRLSAS